MEMCVTRLEKVFPNDFLRFCSKKVVVGAKRHNILRCSFTLLLYIGTQNMYDVAKEMHGEIAKYKLYACVRVLRQFALLARENFVDVWQVGKNYKSGKYSTFLVFW